MLAINIAAQVNRSKGGLQPRSLQELYNNYILIKAISINGFLPITFNLLTIHTVGMVSWYLITLSVLTTAISTATLAVIGNFLPSADDLTYLSQHSATGGPAECGNYDILAYCLDFGGTTITNDPSGAATDMLAFCLVLLVLVILDHARIFEKLSRLQEKPTSSKLQNFLIANLWGVRGGQLALTLVLCILEGMCESSKAKLR